MIFTEDPKYRVMDEKTKVVAVKILNELKGMSIVTATWVLDAAKDLLGQICVPDEIGV